ncbi:Protein archease-like, partial [Durusdinium trenchii]
MAGSEVVVPEWLDSVYPNRERPWRSLQRCSLHVGNDGAGLQMEATELGYLVEAVEKTPGQDQRLRPGVLIIEIAGTPLLALDPDSLEEAFGSNFADGAELLVVEAEELRRATIERDSQGECPCNEADEFPEVVEIEPPEAEVLEHGSVMNLRLCPATKLRDLSPGKRGNLSEDLEHFAELHQLRAELHCPEATTASARLTLCGAPEDVAVAQEEAQKIMRFYDLLPLEEVKEAVSTVEV